MMSVTDKYARDFGAAMRRRMLENDVMNLVGPIINIEDFPDESLRRIMRDKGFREGYEEDHGRPTD